MIAEQKISHALLHKEKIKILAVEDDVLSMEFLKSLIEGLGYNMMTATNGKEAITKLTANHNQIDVVIMDREMPVMNGLDAVKHIKDDPVLRNIPVIMVTGADSADEMKEGLDAGVFYYLTKPVKSSTLRSVLSAAIREASQSKTLAQELSKHKESFDLIDTAKFKFKTLNEAESLSAFIANCFPDPTRVLPGLGELLINAIEHGNLGLGYDRKTEILEAETWRAEIDRLQQLPQHNNKYATATIAHKDDGTYVIIEDQGEGFEWRNFMQIDPARAGDSHGRGIAQANTISFDKLRYNEKGNQAVAFVGHHKQLEW